MKKNYTKDEIKALILVILDEKEKERLDYIQEHGIDPSGTSFRLCYQRALSDLLELLQ